MKQHLFFFLILLHCCLLQTVSGQTIHYVKMAANGNGSSWSNASGDLQAMINSSLPFDQVWVAGGTYKPIHPANDISTTDPNNRDNAFVLKKDVKIFGGFAGSEALLSLRDLSKEENTSILNGNLGDMTHDDDNTFHVVISAGDVGIAELNGFKIEHGNANGTGGGSISLNSVTVFKNYGGGIFNGQSSPILNNLIINENYGEYGGGNSNTGHSSPSLTNMNFSSNHSYAGGAILNDVSSIPILVNVTIKGNKADKSGGGIFNGTSSPILTNVTLSGNTALLGGGIYNFFSSPVLTNVTMAGNEANMGGGIYNTYYSFTKVRNSIIYGNSDGIYLQDLNGSFTTIPFSLVQGYTNSIDNSINGNKDPLFVNQLSPGLSTGGDYRLQNKTSPAYNRGSNIFYNPGLMPDLSPITIDLDGNARIQQGVVDLGAYELNPVKSAYRIIYVTTAGSGDFTGSSWANASNDLQKAMDDTDVLQVWVAKGTYKPKYSSKNGSDANPDDRNNAFILKDGVRVYGGFLGNETLLTQRDSTGITNPTILSGDLGTSAKTDNSYNVVIVSDLVDSTELNGFAITGGDSYGNYTSGGGIMISRSRLVLLSNLVIIGNNATTGGGMNIYFSSAYLNRVTLTENSANNGAAISSNGTFTSSLTNVTISGNEAVSDGGGIYCISMLNLTNVKISGNSAAFRGGGIYVYYPYANDSSTSLILTNVSMSANISSTGGAIYNEASYPCIRNTIIFNNSGGIFNSSSKRISSINYSLVQGLTKESNGNISGNKNPMFVAPLSPGLSTGGDYRLKSDLSPAVNKGNNAFFSSDSIPDLSVVTTDLDGNMRILGIIDLGAYEFSSYPLAITLVNYTAQAEGNRAKLKWTSATESNNKGFIISRSADGRNFTEIGMVNGYGNSSNQNDYVYYDENPLTGINFYGLTQIDYDGKKANLGVRTVNFSSVTSNFIKVYPNPVNSSVQVTFNSNLYDQLNLTDVNGKVLKRLSLSKLATEMKIDMSNLSAGIYFIKLIGIDNVESRKVVKE
ncbi:MAG: T9SS type A sorting domain-containing protein [Ginsengibacter sp.]